MEGIRICDTVKNARAWLDEPGTRSSSSRRPFDPQREHGGPR